MQKPKIDGSNVVFGPARLSYPYLLKRHSFNEGEEGKYSTVVLIPKSETETVQAIQKAIDYAINVGIAGKWGGKRPKYLDSPLYDGDDQCDKRGNPKDNPDATLMGHYYLRTKSNMRPQVYDRAGEPITDEEEIYGGVWAFVSLGFYPYANNGNTGLSCGLRAVKKYKDDTPFGGGGSALADFDGFSEHNDIQDDDCL